MILHASHTHLYPGHRGTLSEPISAPGRQGNHEAIVEFSDGSSSVARISPSENGWLLSTQTYCTAVGTRIPEKHWFIELDENQDPIAFRVVAKATPEK